jgi:hypothetical protein
MKRSTRHDNQTSNQRILGFVAAWRHDFGATDASVLNRMVLQYAVPLTLFVGTIGTPRADLIKGLAFAVAICVAIVGTYGLVFVLFRFVLRFSLSESVLTALIASAPAAPFMGPPILGDLFGKASAAPIAIAALVINLVVVPATVFGLALGKASIVSTTQAPAHDFRFAENSWKPSKNQSYGHPRSHSCSCSATSASLHSSATDFHF